MCYITVIETYVGMTYLLRSLKMTFVVYFFDDEIIFNGED